jgi:hypothetical protein
MYPEGLVTGHLDRSFLGFPLSPRKCCDGSQVPSFYCALLMQPSAFKFFKIKPLVVENIKLNYISNLYNSQS